jgi:hypothetical protein
LPSGRTSNSQAPNPLWLDATFDPVRADRQELLLLQAEGAEDLAHR